MDTNERIATALERIADALEAIAPGAVTAQAQAGTQAHGLPTFYGYPAAWTTDSRGFPSHIITPDGEIAEKRTSQDDVWYSTKTGDEYGPHLAKVRAGEVLPDEAKWTPPASRELRSPENQAPAPPASKPTPATENSAGPAGSHATPPEKRPPERTGDSQGAHIDAAKQAAASPQPEPPEAGNPFDELDEPTLRQLHALGRAVHGAEGWREKGPERVTAHSDGRATSSAQLSHPEAVRLINELKGELEKRSATEYAG